MIRHAPASPRNNALVDHRRGKDRVIVPIPHEVKQGIRRLDLDMHDRSQPARGECHVDKLPGATCEGRQYKRKSDSSAHFDGLVIARTETGRANQMELLGYERRGVLAGNPLVVQERDIGGSEFEIVRNGQRLRMAYVQPNVRMPSLDGFDQRNEQESADAVRHGRKNLTRKLTAQLLDTLGNSIMALEDFACVGAHAQPDLVRGIATPRTPERLASQPPLTPGKNAAERRL